MSRQIKFRVWDINLKYWLPTDDGIYFDIPTEYRKTRKSDVSILIKCIYAFHVQQFTGLTDKNEKEIYEGDVLYCRDDFADDEHSAKFTVLWYEDCWCFQKQGDEKYEGGHCWREVNKDCKVIGNIFENPELLQQA